eukprot:COSAG02_NODE_20814_length_814_cov_35.622378_1_plen_35_part_01
MQRSEVRLLCHKAQIDVGRGEYRVETRVLDGHTPR